MWFKYCCHASGKALNFVEIEYAAHFGFSQFAFKFSIVVLENVWSHSNVACVGMQLKSARKSVCIFQDIIIIMLVLRCYSIDFFVPHYSNCFHGTSFATAIKRTSHGHETNTASDIQSECMVVVYRCSVRWARSKSTVATAKWKTNIWPCDSELLPELICCNQFLMGTNLMIWHSTITVYMTGSVYKQYKLYESPI